MQPQRSLLSLVLAIALVLVTASDALAKTSRKVSHSYERVWPAAVRFLRIDEGLKIIEKDGDSGYVLFELHDEGKVFNGSIEVIRRKDSSRRDAVELILQIKDRPSYMELLILERLLTKLRNELGLPDDPEPEPEPEADEKPKESGDSQDKDAE